MSAKNIALGAIASFVICVVALTSFGKEWLQKLETTDSTVGLVDLARQATQEKKYDKAEDFYKQALTFARQSDKSGENEAFVLTTYAEFVRNKRKNKVLAAQLDDQARKLRLQSLELAGRPPAASENTDR